MKTTEIIRLVVAVATIAIGMTAYSLLIALQTAAA
jgi:hypothetical protein